MLSGKILSSSLLAVLTLAAATLPALAQAPTAPTGLVAAGMTDYSLGTGVIQLSWNDNSTNETAWAIQYSQNGGAFVNLPNSASTTTATTGTTGISLSGAAVGANYSFKVAAFNGSTSSYSNTSATTTVVFTVAATAVPGQAKINLSWPNIVNESGYQILILYPGAFNYEQLTLVAANTTSYQATSPAIEPAKNYSFIVRPYLGSSIIGESNVASVLTDGITSKTGTSGTPGAAFSHNFTVATSGSVTSRSLTGVPSGLSFNSSTGALTGVYPAIGNYTLNFTANLSNGGVLTQTFYIRVRPPAGPPVAGTAIPSWTTLAISERNTALSGTFSDPEAESAVRVSTTLGNMDFILFDTATPATVTNFMNYVNAGKYTDVAFHRSISGFVIQGGGFKGTGTGSNFNSVVTNPPVTNEPGIANTRGTISMAKLGGNPNSATSQFFVSLDDNTANLDYQNGGFTVFGRVAGNGMAVADAISFLPTATYNLFLDGSMSSTPFQNFPMNAVSAPPSMDQTKLVKMNSVTTIPTISHSITGNTNPSVASATIASGQLQLTSLAGGTTTITVTATDLDGLTATQNVPVTVNDNFTTWALRTVFSGGENGITQNPDGDTLNNLQEFAFLTDPSVPSQSAVPAQGKTGGGPEYLTLTFPVRKFTTGLSYLVEANNSLTGSWTTIWTSANGFAHAQVVTAVDQADRTVVTIKDTAAIGGSSTRFLRTRVVQN
jgi:cyclophilin family peptidyl-prolyl cis-trans isomerase